MRGREQVMGDYAIRMQLDIEAGEEAVRRAVETEDGIRAWWSSRTELTGAPPGQDLRVSFPDVPQPFEFEVRPVDGGVDWVTGGFPPWWAGTTIRLTAGPNPEGPGTRLQFVHGGYEPDNPVIPIVTPAWAQILLRLKGYAESGNRQPFFAF
jgi:hypothetical protein